MRESFDCISTSIALLAPVSTAGGSVVEKMNCGAKQRIRSTKRFEPAM